MLHVGDRGANGLRAVGEDGDVQARRHARGDFRQQCLNALDHFDDVGTGLALDFYAPHLRVTGIDFSEEMLEKARARVAEKGLSHVQELRQMDARVLDFPDDHFDAVAVMHVLSVAPEPERVMAEIARVCKPGGRVIITNHFQRDTGFLSRVERLAAPLSSLLGWHSDFAMDRVLQEDRLSVEQTRRLPPMGMMTLLELSKA